MRPTLLAALGFVIACSGEQPVTPAWLDTSSFEHSTPLAEGVDTAALSALIATAKEQQSDALIVVRNGKLIYEDYFGTVDEPILAMSATKSIVSLAFGFLVEDGTLKSLDEPVAAQLPGFATVDSRKAAMTYRHLLSMTSGISPTRSSGGSKDIEVHAIASPLVFAPGASWQYSNNGVDLLSALAGKLAGMPLDVLLAERLFEPMGITNVSWMRDTKGVPLGAGEMRIRPLDMARIGQMILDGGMWHGRLVVNPAWIQESLERSSDYTPRYGYLWWRTINGPTTLGITDDLLLLWTGSGLSAAIAAKLQPLVGVKFSSQSAIYADVAQRLTAAEYDSLIALQQTGDHVDAYRVIDHAPGYSHLASGYLGQYLDIVPSKRLVAVRMRRPRSSDYTNSVEVDAFPNFAALVYRLVP